MTDYTEYIKIFVGIVAILNPLGAIPIIVSLTAGASESELKKIQETVTISVLTVLLVSLFIGKYLLIFFGISIDCLLSLSYLLWFSKVWAVHLLLFMCFILAA